MKLIATKQDVLTLANITCGSWLLSQRKSPQRLLHHLQISSYSQTTTSDSL